MKVITQYSNHLQLSESNVLNTELYDILINANHDVIFTCDVFGKFTSANDKLCYLVGMPVYKILGRSVDEINFTNDFSGFVEHKIRQSINKNETVEAIKSVTMPDGKPYNYNFRFSPFHDEMNNIIGVVGMFREINERRKNERGQKNAILAAIENEKKFIGMELHDNIAQLMVSSLFFLKAAKGKTEKDEEHLQQTIECIHNTISELRDLSHRLLPSKFKENDFITSIADLLHSINKEKQFQINTHFENYYRSHLNHDIELNLYRIFQEQLQNIIKHAEATKIDVSINMNGRKIIMRIADNGKGFDLESAVRGIGFQNIQYRAEIFSGTCDIKSSPGKGCELVVEIPID
jgi:PAS domain S-box-containing protein